ncbi:MAG: hypothetical protein LBR73_02875 [Oscillospiraceae bacterium]|jgi:hypothetical protein|nr:hypothetical protein [Oscillospiraceae bacterium]
MATDIHFITDYPKRSYWLYAPGTGAVMWKSCLKDGCLYFWGGVTGDLNQSQYTDADAMGAAFKMHLEEWPSSGAGVGRSLYAISREMVEGDVIFVLNLSDRKNTLIIGIGVVAAGEYVYIKPNKQWPNGVHSRPAHWIGKDKTELPWPTELPVSSSHLHEISHLEDGRHRVDTLLALFDENTLAKISAIPSAGRKRRKESVSPVKRQEKEKPTPPPPPPKPVVPEVRVGRKVVHKIWGEGTVAAVKKDNQSTTLTVQFSGGEKRVCWEDCYKRKLMALCD